MNTDTDKEKHRPISLREASDTYGFNRAYLRQLALKGRLQAQKMGRDWFTTAQAVEDYIQSRKSTGVYRDDIQVEN